MAIYHPFKGLYTANIKKNGAHKALAACSWWSLPQSSFQPTKPVVGVRGACLLTVSYSISHLYSLLTLKSNTINRKASWCSLNITESRGKQRISQIVTIFILSGPSDSWKKLFQNAAARSEIDKFSAAVSVFSIDWRAYGVLRGQVRQNWAPYHCESQPIIGSP